MNILFLATEMFGRGGGIARFNRQFLVSLATTAGIKKIYMEALLNDNVDKVSLPNVDGIDDISFSKYGFLRRISRSLTKSYDVVLCGHINLFIPALILAFFKRAPVVLVVHGIDAWSYGKNVFRRWLVSKANLIVSVSEFTLSKLRSDIGGVLPETFVLPNSVDLDRFTPGKKNKSLVEALGIGKSKIILFVGRLDAAERYKGVDELIEILPVLIKDDNEIKLLIAGTGNDLQRLQEKVRSLNLDNNVIFSGFIEEHLLVDLFRLADVFAMPGSGEGFGIVYIEAAACGIPVVGSLLDGSSEALLGGELGYLIDPRDKEAIINAVRVQLGKKKFRNPAIEYFSINSFKARTKLLVSKIASLLATR